MPQQELTDSIDQLEQDLRAVDRDRTGLVSCSTFSLVMMRNGGSVEQTEAIMDQFGIPGHETVRYDALLESMRHLAAASASSPSLSPPPRRESSHSLSPLSDGTDGMGALAAAPRGQIGASRSHPPRGSSVERMLRQAKLRAAVPSTKPHTSSPPQTQYKERPQPTPRPISQHASVSNSDASSAARGDLLSLREVFRVVDCKGNGAVRLGEIWEALQTRGVTISLPELEALADSLDMEADPSEVNTSTSMGLDRSLGLVEFCMLVSRMRCSVIERIRRASTWQGQAVAAANAVGRPNGITPSISLLGAHGLSPPPSVHTSVAVSHLADPATPQAQGFSPTDVSVSPTPEAERRRPMEPLSNNHSNSVSIDNRHSMGSNQEKQQQQQHQQQRQHEVETDFLRRLEEEFNERYGGLMTEMNTVSSSPPKQEIDAVQPPQSHGQLRPQVEEQQPHYRSTPTTRTSMTARRAPSVKQPSLPPPLPGPKQQQEEAEVARQRPHQGERRQGQDQSVVASRTLATSSSGLALGRERFGISRVRKDRAPAPSTLAGFYDSGPRRRVAQGSAVSSQNERMMPSSVAKDAWTLDAMSGSSLMQPDSNNGLEERIETVRTVESARYASRLLRPTASSRAHEREERFPFPAPRRASSLATPRSASNDRSRSASSVRPSRSRQVSIDGSHRRDSDAHSISVQHRAQGGSRPALNASSRGGGKGETGVVRVSLVPTRQSAAALGVPPRPPRDVFAAASAKLFGRCSRLLTLCSAYDRAHDGRIAPREFGRALHSAAPDLTEGEIAALVRTAPSTGGRCEYVTLIGELIARESRAGLPAGLDSDGSPSPNSDASSSPPPPQTPTPQATTYTRTSPPPHARRGGAPTNPNSHINAKTREDDATLDEAVWRGRAKMNRLVREALLGAVGGNGRRLRDAFLSVDEERTGYAEERELRTALVGTLRTTHGSAVPVWVVDRCVRMCRAPFEAERAVRETSSAAVAPPTASAAEMEARRRVHRIPPTLWGVLCDYRYLLEELRL